MYHFDPWNVLLLLLQIYRSDLRLVLCSRVTYYILSNKLLFWMQLIVINRLTALIYIFIYICKCMYMYIFLHTILIFLFFCICRSPTRHQMNCWATRTSIQLSSAPFPVTKTKSAQWYKSSSDLTGPGSPFSVSDNSYGYTGNAGLIPASVALQCMYCIPSRDTRCNWQNEAIHARHGQKTSSKPKSTLLLSLPIKGGPLASFLLLLTKMWQEKCGLGQRIGRWRQQWVVSQGSVQ